jgi:hypothetical protein
VEVLVFANHSNPAKERFLRAISMVPFISPTFVLKREQFVALLRNNAFNRKVIVFLAHDQADLTLALSLKAYLSLTRVIMVLSEWNGETLKMGLSISPSLITNTKSNFNDVIAVLEKISTLAH